MALIPRRNPLTSLLNFAADRDREANSIGSVISQIAGPALGQMGVQAEDQPQAAVMRGPVPTAQPLGPMTGPAMAPTPVDFNPRSVELLGAADPRLRDVLTETEKRARERGIEIQVSETKRDAERQAEMVAQGKSQTMNSKHLTGNAADIFIQNPDGSANWDFEAYRPVAELAKEVAAEKGYDDLVWGGDWKTLKDGVHFQLGGATVTGGGNALSLMGGAGADTLGGNNVEDILAQLYPQMSPEDEKRQRRKDLFAAASQGFSALSQGRPIDFSNIRADRDARQRQSVLDMRDRERARAAASLVLDQGGSPAMATALVTGAASMGDFLTDRQLRKAQETADKQKLLDIQRTELLVPVLKSAGFSDARIAEMVEYGKEGGDLTELMTFEQTSAAAEKAREAEVAQDELAQEYLASDDQQLRTLGRLIQSGLPIKDAIDSATKLYPAAGGTKEFADLAEAQAIVDSGAINPATNEPFRSVGEVRAADLFRPEAANAAQPMVTYNPDGSMTITPPALAPAGVAPAQAAVTTAAPAAVGAPTGVAGAFNQQFGGMETGIPTGAPAVAAQALPLDVAQGVADLENTLAQAALRAQELDEAIANAPDNATKLRLEGERIAAQTELDQLSLQQQIAAEPDVTRKRQLEIELTELQIQNEADKAAATEAKADLRKQQREIRSNDTMRLLSDVYDRSLGFMSGPIPGFARGLIAEYFGASEAGQAKGQLEGVQVGIFTDQLSGMRESSQTGAAVGNVTDSERQAFASALGKLDVGGDPELLRQNLRAVANASLNLMHGTPDKLRAAVERGELDAETAERYGARYDIDGTADTGMVGELGPVVPLGIAAVDENVLSLEQAPVAELVAPDSPDPEYEAALIENPALLYATTPDDYAKLSPAQKAVFDRLMEDSP
jgi:hypothetical protein